jgi:rfaE bifunctional protein nucleotidyltransferase chain/domain
LNSDASVKRLKGPERPINDAESRASILANLVLVDVVVVFEEDTPLQLIQTLLPDVLVKGGDYTIDTIVGAKEVIANGGKVIINPIVEGFSTTNIIEKIKK